ncbi:MAG: TIGR04086 family membrane protein [Peptococcia bacterium]
MLKTDHQTEAQGLKLRSIIKGLIWSLITTFILSILFSLLLQYTSLSEGMLDSYGTFIFFISMLVGSIIGARSAGCKGLWHGLSITLVYFLFTLLFGLALSASSLTSIFVLKRLVAALAAGVLGGIIGIGLAN